jgi:cytochrome P450
VRYCIKDTTLPTGGGPDGQQPIFVAKGDIMHCNRFLMHRDPDLWGADAEEFRPERWETARPMWNFVPFGGGPRICPAHVMVDTECSYAVFRILQRFKAIEVRDKEPYIAVMRVGPSSKNGCKVAFVPA